MAIQDFEDWSTRVYWDYYFTILQDTPVSYDGAAKKSVIVNDTETGLNYSNASVDDHSARHEEGGVDEVTGITGKLNDHSARHEDGGADPINNLGGNVAFPDRSAFNAYMSTDQDLTAGDIITLQFDTVVFDKQSEFDISNYYFKPKAAGLYYLCAGLRVENFSDNDFLTLFVYKNGTIMVFLHDQSAGNCIQQGMFAGIVASLVAGDTIDVMVRNNDNNCNLNTAPAYTYFCGFRVG